MRSWFIVLALVFFTASPCLAGEYESLLEKGEFFLEKGNAYAPDAVRSLEKAAQKNGERAAKDHRFVLALATAYTKVHRLSEAWYWIETFERQAQPTADTEGIKDYLLNEAGVGRLRLTCSIPSAGVTVAFESTGNAKIDVTGRKILDKLNRWLEKPFDLDAEGLTILVPEGEYKLSASLPLGRAQAESVILEVWAGDELEQGLVAYFPPAEQIASAAGNRTVELTWPATEGASYKLVRLMEGEEPVEVYEGGEPTFKDTGLITGAAIEYQLLTLGPDSAPWAVSSVSAMALPPVSEIWGEATLGGDLFVTLWWAVGEGALDRLVVLKEHDGSVTTLLDATGDEILRSAELKDGPMMPTKSEVEINYRVQAWVDGEPEPREFQAPLTIAPEVVEIDSVTEDISPEIIYVEWATVPEDALAEGYAIYLVRSRLGHGKLVGKVHDAMAREFSYVPKGKDEPDAQWRHIVMPYIGDRLLVWPDPVELTTELPQEDELDKRYDRAMSRGRRLPNVMLSWDRHPDAKRYLVRRIGITGGDEEEGADGAEDEAYEGEQDVDEWIVKKPAFDYMELRGLQTVLMGTRHRVEVSAVLYSGEVAPIMSLDLNYEHYPRSGGR